MSGTQLPFSDQRSGLRIALGILCILLGLGAIIWTGATLLVVALLFGLELISAGMVRIASAVVLKALPGWWRALSAVLGVLTILAGIICLIRPGASLFALVVVIAVGWLLDGASELVSAFTVSRQASERVGLVAFGLVSIIAAFVLLTVPGASLVLLARIGGVILIAIGIASLVTAFAARRDKAATADTTPAAN